MNVYEPVFSDDSRLWTVELVNYPEFRSVEYHEAESEDKAWEIYYELKKYVEEYYEEMEQEDQMEFDYGE